MAGQKYNKAYEAYQQAVYRDGRNPTFWCSIGVLYFQINQYRDALDAYSRAIRINPYISEVWFDLGSLYESCNNQISDAIDAYARASELDARSAGPSPHTFPKKRQLPDPNSRVPHCGGVDIDEQSISDAEHDLANNGCKGNPWLNDGNAVWSIRGDVVVFFCAWKKNPCVVDELFQAGQVLNSDCGLGKTGWLDIWTWKKAYGRERRTFEFCGRRIDS